MSRPRLLDLFCGAGGAAMGYYRAGFDVVGVDIAPQKRYPFEFHQADALTYSLDGFDVIHASPPCQGYSASKGLARTAIKTWQPLLAPMRERLEAAGAPWVMENVAAARSAMRWPLRLCGTQFGLRVYRHRLFETSMPLFSPGKCSHPRYLEVDYLCVYGNHARRRQTGNRGNRYQRATVAEARLAMGIDWMTQKELSQSVPPAYTEWIGRQLLAALALDEVV